MLGFDVEEIGVVEIFVDVFWSLWLLCEESDDEWEGREEMEGVLGGDLEAVDELGISNGSHININLYIQY